MAISIYAAASDTFSGSGPYTLSIGVRNPSSDALIVVVATGIRGATTSWSWTSATMAGNTMNLEVQDSIAANNRNVQTSIYTLDYTGSGASALNLSFTPSASLLDAALHAYCLEGVNITTSPVGDVDSYAAAGVTSFSVSLTTVNSNSWLIGGAAARNGNLSWSPGTGVTEYFETSGGSDTTQNISAFSGYRVATSPDTYSFASTLSASNNGALAAIVVNASGGTEYSKTLSGVSSFSGSAQKRPAKSYAGSTSFSGANIRRTNKALNGLLSLSATLAEEVKKALIGAVGFSGTLSKAAFRSIAGALSFARSALKSILRGIDGVLSFSGSVDALKQLIVNISGFLGFSGDSTKSSRRTLLGAISFAGLLTQTKQIVLALSGALSATGNLARQSQKTIGGLIDWGRGVNKSIQKAIGGTLDWVRSIAKQSSLFVLGELSFGGLLESVKALLLNLSGQLSASGQLAKSTLISLSGSLNAFGNVFKISNRAIGSALDFVGQLTKSFLMLVSGTLNSSGSINTFISKAIEGVLDFSGALVRTSQKVLIGTINFIGETVRNLLPGGIIALVNLTAKARSFALSAQERIFNLTAKGRNK